MICLVIMSALTWAGLTKVLLSPIVVCRGISFHLMLTLTKNSVFPNSPSLQTITIYANLPLSRQFWLPPGCVYVYPRERVCYCHQAPLATPPTRMWFTSCLTPPTWPPLPQPPPAPLPGVYPYGFCLLCPISPFWFQLCCPMYNSWFPTLLTFCFLDGIKVALQFPMNLIRFSRIYPHKGACARVHCLMHSPL